MIVDIFPFFNELDLLELRLRTLSPTVGRFVAVQATQTHAGQPKPLYLNIYDPRWEPWKGLLNTVILPDIETTDPWVRERATRAVVPECLTRQQDDDLVVMSDADELPDPEQIAWATPHVTDERWAGFSTSMFFYYLNLRVRERWPCIALARVSTVRRLGGQAFREARLHPPIGPIMGGWHFSYMGGAVAIQDKLKAFAHEEYDRPPFTDLAWIKEKVRNHQDLYRVGMMGRLTRAPMSDMPPVVQQDPGHFAHMLLSGDSNDD